jgi:hypothetical protein
MPYIAEQEKDLLLKRSPENPGELNFTLTEVIKGYIHNNGECYRTYNDIIGALEGAKLELYRRKVSDYEDKKIEENGDVY